MSWVTIFHLHIIPTLINTKYWRFVVVLPSLHGYKSSLTSFGFIVGLCSLALCPAVVWEIIEYSEQI